MIFTVRELVNLLNYFSVCLLSYIVSILGLPGFCTGMGFCGVCFVGVFYGYVLLVFFFFPPEMYSTS